MNRKKLVVALSILTLLLLFYYFELYSYLTIQSLQNHKALLLNAVSHKFWQISVIFCITYATATGFSLPGASIFSLTGGFLFGWKVGGLLNIISASIGAVIAFLLTRYVIGEYIQNNYQHQLANFNKEVKRNGFYYLLTMRLIFVIPFFVLNLLCGLTNIPLSTFIATTVLGIIPGAFAYAYAGQQLGSITSAKDIISGPMLMAFGMLALLALLPVIVKKLRLKK